MRIDIWSDYACPFCYIGKRRLENALSQFPNRNQVEVVFRSFQLDPNAEVSTDKSIHELLATKYGMTVEKAKAMNAQLAEQAKDVGLEFNFDTVKHTNTFDSHRLSHFASTKGKGAEMSERLLRAYFTDSLNLGDRSVLASLAAEVGLDQAEAAAMLETDAFANEVNGDIEEGSRLNITGVPFFVFNNKYALSGAQPGPVFTEVLDTVWAEEQAGPTLQVVGKGNSEVSTDDGCADGSCNI
ncbi:disulfide bond formation protein DsbA [Paenibacillus odorifer]|uniref:DsbA family oxidoreductase n=1 Tax=Paenibacillus odorifer TaxID=189426 RepID=UPI00096C21A4|nr:DsbA family oxidoreductase [Paenibacillus odorifer]OMD70560.1 disulfide bond formation protein DsbA [Paenibacillus odorifer]OME00816.1 disulfide bond formation protein DsbA [Paenibacillus odorifer]